MRICSIASGSSGNCIYVGAGDKHFLIDAGITCKRIVEALTSINVSANDICAMFVTHEHSDHIASVGAMARKCHIPIYTTTETYYAMLHGKTNIGNIDSSLFHPVCDGEVINFDNVMVTPFAISHDAANPVAYTFSDGYKKIGMAADLGIYDSNTIVNLSGCDCLYLESNHDKSMLMVGVYPFYLKQRVAGEHGHLSNDQCAELIKAVYNENLKTVLLGHISRENNLYDLAYESMRCYLTELYGSEEAIPEIIVARHDCMTKLVEV